MTTSNPPSCSAALITATAYRPAAAQPPSISQALSNLADQPATHTSFTFDRSMLQIAQSFSNPAESTSNAPPPRSPASPSTTTTTPSPPSTPLRPWPPSSPPTTPPAGSTSSTPTPPQPTPLSPTPPSPTSGCTSTDRHRRRHRPRPRPPRHERHPDLCEPSAPSTSSTSAATSASPRSTPTPSWSPPPTANNPRSKRCHWTLARLHRSKKSSFRPMLLIALS